MARRIIRTRHLSKAVGWVAAGVLVCAAMGAGCNRQKQTTGRDLENIAAQQRIAFCTNAYDVNLPLAIRCS